MNDSNHGAHPIRTLLIVSAALSVLACSIVLADGDSRKPTQAEKDFNNKVLSVIDKAMPAGPEGWEKSGNSTGIPELETVYTEAKEPLRMDYCIAWDDSKRQSEARDRFDEELTKLARKPGSTAGQLEELQQKMVLRDATVRIDVYVNIASSHGIYEKVAPAPAVAGGLAYRGPGEYTSDTGWREGPTYVFLGKSWKLDTSGGTYVNFTPGKKAIASTAVQNIVVKVQADSSRARRIVQAIDWEALNALMNK